MSSAILTRTRKTRRKVSNLALAPLVTHIRNYQDCADYFPPEDAEFWGTPSNNLDGRYPDYFALLCDTDSRDTLIIYTPTWDEYAVKVRGKVIAIYPKRKLPLIRASRFSPPIVLSRLRQLGIPIRRKKGEVFIGETLVSSGGWWTYDGIEAKQCSFDTNEEDE